VGDEFALMLRAGIDDWGGVSPVTADHVNPERPWPAIDELAERSAEAGFTLRERLTAYPRYVLAGSPWIDTRLHGHVAALADPETGLAREGAVPVGRPWQEPDGGFASTGRVDLNATIDSTGRTVDRRGDFASVYGDWDSLREQLDATRQGTPERLDADVRAGLALASSDPAALLDPANTDFAMFVPRRGTRTRAGPGGGRAAPRRRRGRRHHVVNRNINFSASAMWAAGSAPSPARRRRRVQAVAGSPRGPWRRPRQVPGVCMQGGIDRSCPSPSTQISSVPCGPPSRDACAFCRWRSSAAAKAGVSIQVAHRLRAAGLGSIPGTAAEILDDDVRWTLTKGKLPADTWEQIVRTAHHLGIRSSSTMMFGHVDAPPHWVAHIRRIGRIQQDTGGFTEFVPLPFVHRNAPIYLAGRARPGPTPEESLRVHAVARILLDRSIDNVQVSWVKLGVEACQRILRAGANDFGGTLMEETISRMAGAEWGIEMTPDMFDDAIRAIGRIPAIRTTTYDRVVRVEDAADRVSVSMVDGSRQAG
jgi:FO synthase